MRSTHVRHASLPPNGENQLPLVLPWCLPSRSMYYEEHPRQPDVVTLAPWWVGWPGAFRLIPAAACHGCGCRRSLPAAPHEVTSCALLPPSKPSLRVVHSAPGPPSSPRVARLYERRLHRRQRAAAGVMRSTAGAEEGNCGEVEGEVTALTSMSESDTESAIGF